MSKFKNMYGKNIFQAKAEKVTLVSVITCAAGNESRIRLRFLFFCVLRLSDNRFFSVIFPIKLALN